MKKNVAFSRRIVEELTCNSCGKKKTVNYVHIGVDKKYPVKLIRPADGNFDVMEKEDEFYQISATEHLCGRCLNAARAAAKP